MVHDVPVDGDTLWCSVQRAPRYRLDRYVFLSKPRGREYYPSRAFVIGQSAGYSSNGSQVATMLPYYDNNTAPLPSVQLGPVL
jgi:hypothetical protein